MCAQVRQSVIQRTNLRMFVNTAPEVTFCIWTFVHSNFLLLEKY